MKPPSVSNNQPSSPKKTKTKPKQKHRLPGFLTPPGKNVTPLAEQKPEGLVTESSSPQNGLDQPLFFTTLALLVFGLVAVYTASAHEALEQTGNSLSTVFKQLIAAVLGILLMVVTSRIDFRAWQTLARPLAVVTLLLLLGTDLFGVTANGSERWISLPFGFQFQPSEFGKFATVSLMAQGLAMRKKVLSNNMVLNLLLIGAMIFLIYEQPHLSIAMILGFITLTMLFVGGLNAVYYLLVLPPITYGLMLKIMNTEYQRKRITGWLDPWGDPQGTGYNLIQSYFAIGAGGLLGRGLGNSVQKLYYLPFQHTDFIFAVICEELGFIGAVILIGLFCMLAWRGFSIALNCPDRFGQLLAFGVTCTIAYQVIINICVTIGLMPVTGATLPLISYGGTSLVLTLMMIGVLLNISRSRKVLTISQRA